MPLPSSAKLAMKINSLIQIGQRHNWCSDSVLEGRYPTGIWVQPVHDHLGSHFSLEKHFLPGKTENLASLGIPALHLEDGAASSEKCSNSE